MKLNYVTLRFFFKEPPPCTVDFLTILRNNFKETIAPRLDLQTWEALLLQKSPQELGDKKAKKIKDAILDSVYGK